MKLKIKKIFTLIIFISIFIFNIESANGVSMTGGQINQKETETNGSIFLQYKSTCQPNADIHFPIITAQDNTKPNETWTKMNDNDFGYTKIPINKKIIANYFKTNIFTNKRTDPVIFSERSIIYKKGTTEAKYIYIYWHGLGWYEHTTQSMCNGKSEGQPYTDFCKRAGQIPGSIIVAPRTMNLGSGSQKYTNDEMTCFLDEVKKILTEKKIDYKNAKIIIAGHSGGGAVISQNLATRQWTNGNQIAAALFFEATYAGWGTTALNYNKGVPIFVYYGEDGEPKLYNKNDLILDSSGKPIMIDDPEDETEPISKIQKTRGVTEWQGAQDTKIKRPDQVKILETKTKIHAKCINECFLDHLNGKGCTGGSFLPINYTSTATPPETFTNSFETIDGAPTVTQSNNYSEPVSSISLTDELKTLTKTPQLQIKIPGLNITDGVSLIKRDGIIYLQSTIFQQYLVAIYKYSVVAISVLAVIMIMVSGIQWLVSGGSPDKIGAAKKRIGGSIVGIILAVGSYTILYTINPNLTKFGLLETHYLYDGGNLVENDSVPANENIGTPNSSLSNVTLNGNFNQNVYPLTEDSIVNKGQRNNFGATRKATVDKNEIQRCHAGVDILTKPPGIVVSISDGEVQYITTHFMKLGRCEGTEGADSRPWKNSDMSLQKGMAGGMLIYDPDQKLTYWYGEINEPSIEEFIEQHKKEMVCESSKFWEKPPTNSRGEQTVPQEILNNTGKTRQICRPKSGQKIEVKRGDKLGIASRCGMLHFEVYKEKQTTQVGLSWQDTSKNYQSSTDAHYCLTQNITDNRPPKLIDAEQILNALTNKLKSS